MSEHDDLLPDPRLLGLVRRAFDQGPSAAALDRARHAGRLARRQRSLARIEDDSLGSGRLLRDGAGRDRSLSLRTGALTLDLDVLEHERLVMGRVAPTGPASVTVADFDGSRRTGTDEEGRFVVPLARGPFRVTIETPDDRLESPWISR